MRQAYCDVISPCRALGWHLARHGIPVTYHLRLHEETGEVAQAIFYQIRPSRCGSRARSSISPDNSCYQRCRRRSWRPCPTPDPTNRPPRDSGKRGQTDREIRSITGLIIRAGPSFAEEELAAYAKMSHGWRSWLACRKESQYSLDYPDSAHVVSLHLVHP